MTKQDGPPPDVCPSACPRGGRKVPGEASRPPSALLRTVGRLSRRRCRQRSRLRRGRIRSGPRPIRSRWRTRRCSRSRTRERHSQRGYRIGSLAVLTHKGIPSSGMLVVAARVTAASDDRQARGRRHGAGDQPARTSAPYSVTAMVCSTCEARLASAVTTDQRSSRSRTAPPPRVNIGSMAIVMPGLSRRPVPGLP